MILARDRQLVMATVALGMAIVIFITAVACAPIATDDVTTPVPTPPRARDVELVRQPNGSWRADSYERMPLVRVVRVVDGDTLITEEPDGSSQRVRVFGIRAPELADACGPEATSDLERAVGSTVRLLEDERSQDPFGRELRYVFTPDGISVDAELIRHGAARAWRDDGAFRETLTRIEATARNEGRGCLWDQ